MTKRALMPWAKLVPELVVRDLQASLRFWCGLLGFRIVYQRPADGFAYLDRAGAHVMLEERSDAARQWIAAELAPPFGRGVNFQVTVDDVDAICAILADAAWPLFSEREERWYRADTVDLGVRQCVVADPDGYLVRLSQDIGTRPSADPGTHRRVP